MADLHTGAGRAVIDEIDEKVADRPRDRARLRAQRVDDRSRGRSKELGHGRRLIEGEQHLLAIGE